MDRLKHEKFMGLVENCRKPLLNYIRYSLWNKAMLEDAFQNTVMEGWKKFGSFSGDESGFRVWLFQIANFIIKNLNRITLKNEHRKEGTRQENAVETAGSFASLINEKQYQQFLDNSDSILNVMEDRIKESVMTLPANERSVFLLRSVGDFSYEEISSMLSLPIGSVMGFLARARIKLRENLLDYAKEQHNL